MRRLIGRDAQDRQEKHQRRHHHKSAADAKQATGKACSRTGQKQSRKRKSEWEDCALPRRD